LKTPYKIFTRSTKAEEIKQHFKDCQENENIHIQVKAKNKFASVEWDLITLNSINHIRVNDTCILGKDIEKLYRKYMIESEFKKRANFYQFNNCCGIVYIYKKDIEDFVPKLCKLVDKVLETNCIEFKTLEEKIKLKTDDLEMQKLLYKYSPYNNR